MKYFLLCLDNNKCSNPTKISGVKLVQSIPSVEDESYYEPVELLAYETGMFYNSRMIDVLTGKEIFLNDGSTIPHITYSSKKQIAESELIRISEIYKNLSEDELNRYKKGLNEIESISINNYNRMIEEKELYNNRLRNATSFLSSFTKEN